MQTYFRFERYSTSSSIVSADRFEQIFLAFSLWRTLPRILSAKAPKGSFRCINGLRFLAMCWIMLGHTFVLGPTTTSTQAVGECSNYEISQPDFQAVYVYCTYFQTSNFCR